MKTAVTKLTLHFLVHAIAYRVLRVLKHIMTFVIPSDSEYPGVVIVAAVIPSIVAVVAIALFGVVLCFYIRLRVQLHKKQNSVAARDYPEYAVVEPNLAGRQTIDTRQNVAYETAMQATETNAAYQVGMQGHSPEQQNSL